MADRDDDLVMESTTDSPEQIAEGLGIELAEDQPAVEAAAEGDAAPVTEPADDEAETEPVGEVTPEPAKVVAAKPRAGEPKKKLAAPRNVNGAIAAVRREEEARRKVAETERDAALARIAELTAGRPAQTAAAAHAERADLARVTAVKPEDVPDTYPEIAALTTKITALGPKPKQADFADFDEFEEKRDTWIEERARLRARVDSVREDVARRETVAIAEAHRAAQETTTAFQASEATARARHADYDDKVKATIAAGLIVSDDLGRAILESPHGGELRYYLMANPAEVARLNALSPHRQLVEIGMVESRIAASLQPDGRHEPTRPTARTTRAPDPQRNLVGELPSAARKKDLNDPSLTQAEYNRLRDEMDRESGRRVTH